MDPVEKYEIIGNYIFRYGRVKLHLNLLLMALAPQADTELLESEADIIIPRINAELSNRGPEIMQQFSAVAVEMYGLKSARDLNMNPAHEPDGREMTIFLNRCTDVLAQLAAIKALIAER